MTNDERNPNDECPKCRGDSLISVFGFSRFLRISPFGFHSSFVIRHSSFVLVLLICLTAISRKSLWIDEALTAVKAMQPTFHSWWAAMVQERTSDLQMPFYMIYVWGFEKLFGSGEWTLRLANLPWYVAGAAAFIQSFPPEKCRRAIAALLTLFCPFGWYYLDEARPYAMLVGASLFIAAALIHLGRNSAAGRDAGPPGSAGSPAGAAPKSVHIIMFLGGIVVLSGTTMLGMIWAMAALAILLALLPRAQIMSLLRETWRMWLPAAAILLGLAAYYAWTLKVGARGGAASATTLGSILFVGYELLGFGGLGAGRLEIRDAGLAALKPYGPLLASYGAAIFILIVAALRNRWESNRRNLLIILFVCSFPIVFILATGLAAHWRVLGRHLAPIIPALLFILIDGFSALWSRRPVAARLAPLLFCGLTVLSCLSLRFAPRHAKDDYRGVSAVAKNALNRGQRVWWNAAPEGARYYGVPVNTNASSSNQVIFVMNPTPELIEHLPPPDVIIASKPDIYDSGMALSEYLHERSFKRVSQFAAFTVWERGR